MPISMFRRRRCSSSSVLDVPLRAQRVARPRCPACARRRGPARPRSQRQQERPHADAAPVADVGLDRPPCTGRCPQTLSAARSFADARAGCAPARRRRRRRRAWSAGAAPAASGAAAAPASARNRRFTMRSSSEWNAMTHSRPPASGSPAATARNALELAQLVVDRDAQRLKRPRRRVLVPLAARHRARDHRRQLAGGVAAARVGAPPRWRARSRAA